MKQRTIERVISAVGVGVHTGKTVNITLRPADPDTGVVFRRVDFPTPVAIKASVENVGDTRWSTCLVKGDVRVATVEHLLSAFAGLGIDNVIVDLDAPEIPIMDGSAGPFVFLIQSAGIVSQDAAKKFLVIKQKVEVQQDDKMSALLPYPGLKVTFKIAFDHPLFNLNNQYVEIDFAHTSFTKEISRARTFGFLADYDYLRNNNLALGCNLNNSIVLGDSEVLNEDGLRYKNEFVRHKVLDVVGDLYLLGHSIIGSYEGFKSGHTINNILLRKLLAAKDSFELVTFRDDEDIPVSFG